MSSGDNFKILSFDGGGIRGLFSAVLIKQVERTCNIKAREYFDLIVGTSTGSILASAIAEDIDIDKVISLYSEHGSKIFSKKHCGFLKSKYDNKYILSLLSKEFGEKTLGDVEKALMIVSVDIKNASVFVHKTGYLANIEPYSRDGNTRLKDAIMSSCSAPTYFDPYLINNQHFLCDGGLWANNPSIIATVEAISKFKKTISDVRILSIGTGDSGFEGYSNKSKWWGYFAGWKREKVLDFILNLSSQSATNMTNLLLGDNYLRLNTQIQHDLDDTKHLDKLMQKAEECFAENADSRIKCNNSKKIKRRLPIRL